MYRKKTFKQKLADDKDLPRVEPLTGAMARRYGPGTMVLSPASEIDAIMRQVPKGSVTTVNEIRTLLARRHGAIIACPIVTGIHARIAAGAAGEDEALGRERVTPYWRTLKVGGELNQKYPGGIAGQAKRLRAEGLTVTTRGKRVFVAEYATHLAHLGHFERHKHAATGAP